MERGVACSFTVADGSLLTAIESAAQAAEEAGLASWWAVGDREQLAPDSHDGTLGLQCVARATSRLRLGVGGDILAAHNLGVRAKQLASLDWFSDGRLEHGLDLGGLPDALRGSFLGDVETDLAHTAEILAAMRALWTQDRATHHGRHLDFAGAIALPKPVGHRRLTTHVRHGDVDVASALEQLGDVAGWLAWQVDPVDVGAALDDLETALGDTGATVRRTWFVRSEQVADALGSAAVKEGRVDELVAVHAFVPSPEDVRALADA